MIEYVSHEKIPCLASLIQIVLTGVIALVASEFNFISNISFEGNHANGNLSLFNESFKRTPRSLRGTCLLGGSVKPARRLHEPFAEVAYTEGLHEDALEGSRGLLEGSMDELRVHTR